MAGQAGLTVLWAAGRICFSTDVTQINNMTTYNQLEPYQQADEVFRFIHDTKPCLVTDVEYHMRQHYPGTNVRPIIVELEEAGMVHTEAGFTYVSMKPKGTETIRKHGLYSTYLKSIEDDKFLSKKLILEQIKEFNRNNWYKKWEFWLAFISILLSVIALVK